jgi:membrane dipeptidase
LSSQLEALPFRIESLLIMSKLIFALAIAVACAAPISAQTVSKKAQEIQNSAIVIDTHADTPQRFLDENYDIASTDPKDHGHISLDKAKAGNLGAEFFSIWVDPDTNRGHFARHTLDLIDSVYEQAAHHPDRMMMAFSVADIEHAHRQHKLAALLGIEGGHSIENDIRLLRDFYRLGVRYMTLSWSNTNEWADSSGDINDPKIEHHNGLTEGGKQIVQEMNRLGMLVDISHVADKTFYDAIAISKAPLIASHSSARALTNHPRNMTDDMLRAIAKNGGVVQVNFYSAFIDENYRKAAEAQAKDRDAAVKAYTDKMKASYTPPPCRRSALHPFCQGRTHRRRQLYRPRHRHQGLDQPRLHAKKHGVPLYDGTIFHRVIPAIHDSRRRSRRRRHRRSRLQVQE